MSIIMIFGASSAVAEEIAKKYATNENELILIARNKEKLDIICSDLKIRGAKNTTPIVMDACDFDKHGSLFSNYNPDTFIVAHGELTIQSKAQKDIDYLRHQVDINLNSIISLVSHAANYFEQKATGTIAVIGSVAGDRGRLSNYVYGTAKGAIEIFLQGIRHRLATKNINVLCVKPGFIDSPMTSHIQPKGALWAKPSNIANDIVSAIKSKKQIIYTPGIWYWIMFIIRNIPNFIFHKTKL